MTRLAAEHLEKSYKRRKVVKDVSFHIDTGEVVGLLGPNGAGKTTSFYMVVGLVPSDGGIVKLGDTDITHAPMYKRAKMGIGYLPQEPSIFRKLSVEDNIMAVLQLRKELKKHQRETLLEELLHEFNIEHIRTSMGLSLSGGERRRVEIARALAREPKFILLDEPFAGIDPISVVDIKEVIEQLRKKNIGILITDHNVRETLDICERAYIVSEGEILCEGNPIDILNNEQVKDVYLGHQFKV